MLGLYSFGEVGRDGGDDVEEDHGLLDPILREGKFRWPLSADGVTEFA